MGKPVSIDIVKEFSRVIAEGIADYFGGAEPSTELSIEFLSRHGLVRPEDIRDYMILYEYPKLLARPDKTSYDAVVDLAQKYDVSERTVQYKIYNSHTKYIPKNNVKA